MKARLDTTLVPSPENFQFKMDPKRTIRAPTTITKSSKPSVYTGNLARTKFRLIRPATSSSVASNLPTSTTGANISTNYTATTRIPGPNSSSSGIFNGAHPSRLVTPAPTRLISAMTTSRKPQATNQQQRPATSSVATLKFQPVKLASVKKSAALNLDHPSNAIITTTTNGIQNLHLNDTNSLLSSSLSSDAGEIRRLLQRLLIILQEAPDCNEDTLSKENERLVEENKALRKEVDELRLTLENLKSVKHQREVSTDTFLMRDRRTYNSEHFYSPMG